VIVVDASAIVAILSREPKFAALIAAIERADRVATSPMAILMKRRSDCGGIAPWPKQRPTSWSFSASPVSR
jgi:hypothetical protein